MLSYAKLWDLLESRGMKKTDLKEVISGNTLAKLGKNEVISSAVIEKLCAFLDCQPGDIMEYVSQKKIEEVVKQFGDMSQAMVNSIKDSNVSKEEFMKAMGEAMEMIFNGENPMEKAMEEAVKQREDTEDVNE